MSRKSWQMMAAVWAAGLVMGSVQAEPQVNLVAPFALRPGTTTEVKVLGKELTDLVSVWTSFGATFEIATEEAGNGSVAILRFTLPAEPSAGFGAFRLISTKGVSAPCLVMLDGLPATTEDGKNVSPATAKKLDWPGAVDGACSFVGDDYYRITGRKGQWITIEAVAQRIGSRLDPAISLRTLEGHELAFCDDAPGIAPDAILRCQFPADGDYFVTIRDSTYGTGGDHIYHLRLGAFPAQATPFPLAVQRGVETEVSFPGAAAPGVAAIRVKARDSADSAMAGVSFPEGGGFAPVTLLADELPEAVEVEPNDESGKATRVTLPAGINGIFGQPGDRDWFEFEVRKGDRWRFAGQARALGSPAELFLRLYDANGKVIEESEVTEAAEASVDHRFGSDGIYRLRAEELSGLGSPAHAYRIEARPWSDGFDLTVETDTVNVEPGKSVQVKVKANRRKFEGEIKLDVATDIEWLDVESATIEKKKDEGTLTLKVPDTVSAGEIRHFQVTGTATIDGQPYTATASTMPALLKRWPQTGNPPRELRGRIALGIRKP